MSSLFFVIQIFHGWRQVWNVGRISPADKAQQSIHNSTNASRESKDNAFLATPKSRCVDVGWNSKSQAAAESKKSSQQDACAYRAYAPLLCVGCAVGGGSFVLSTQRQQNFIVEAFQWTLRATTQAVPKHAFIAHSLWKNYWKLVDVSNLVSLDKTVPWNVIWAVIHIF